MSHATSIALTGLLALPLFTACGSAQGSPGDAAALTDAGYARLGSSDWSDALREFDRALESIEPGGPGFERAAMGAVEAQVQLDAGLGRDRFLTLAREFPGAIGARGYASVCSSLTAAGHTPEAIEVLHAGLTAHPGHPELVAVLENLERQAPETAESEALKQIQSMAYLGGKG